MDVDGRLRDLYLNDTRRRDVCVVLGDTFLRRVDGRLDALLRFCLVLVARIRGL